MKELREADYVPVLPEVKARALAIDPAKGYLVLLWRSSRACL